MPLSSRHQGDRFPALVDTVARLPPLLIEQLRETVERHAPNRPAATRAARFRTPAGDARR